MDLTEGEITRLYRVRKTVMQILEDWDYIIVDHDLNMTMSQFKNKYGENMKRDDLSIEGSEIYVFFPDKPKIGVKTIKNYIKRLVQDDTDKAIVLIQQNLTPFAKRFISEMRSKYYLEVFLEIWFTEEEIMRLKTHDLVFASRPPHEGAKYISYGQRNLSLAEYGSYWRDMRKMCTLELLSNHKINSFKSMRKEEVTLFVDSIRESEAKEQRVSVDLSSKVSSLSADMTCRMVFGKKYMDEEFSERGFKSVIQEGLQLGAAHNLGDYIPCIAPLDLQGFTKRMKAVHRVFDDFLEKIVEEHLQSRDHGERRTKDFVDVMLGFMGSEESAYRIGRSNIKAIILDMLASMDTSATTIEWALSELIRHPEVMKKVQIELANVVGMERMVEESDMEKLEYLDMVVKETLRLHPIAPLLLPHQSTEDCTVNGFHIPKKSRIMVNVWSIGRDPNPWTEAEKFIPERFVDSSIDLRGNHFELLPFGSGRRRCPGIQLGLTVVQLVLAQLVHCFNWELPENMSPNDLDMTEEFGITVPRAKHLLAIPSYRLHK